MSRNFELMQQLEVVPQRPARKTVAPGICEPNQIGIVVRESQWAGREALAIVQRIFLPQRENSPRTVTFAGVNHGDGCTGICAKVAETLAGNGYGPVCVVEANFRSPSLSRMMGTNNHGGLVDALLGDGPIRSFARPTNVDELWLIPCGEDAVNRPSLLSSERVKQRLDELRVEFPYVIVDVPPVTESSDAVAVGQLTDGIVLVLGADSTRRESAQMATETIRSAMIPILGAVLNKRTFPIPEQIYNRL